MGVLADRQNLTREEIHDRWAACDIDRLWEDLGPVLDSLETGYYDVKEN